MRGVEAVGCRDDFASVEHALKHLFHKCMILTGRVEAYRVGTSPTPTMDGDVVFAFVVGGRGVYYWFVRPVKEVEGALLLFSIPGGTNAGCWISAEQAIDIHDLPKL